MRAWWSWPIAEREVATPVGFTPLSPPRLKGDPSPPFKGKKFRNAAKRERKQQRKAARRVFRTRILDTARIVFVSSE